MNTEHYTMPRVQLRTLLVHTYIHCQVYSQIGLDIIEGREDEMRLMSGMGFMWDSHEEARVLDKWTQNIWSRVLDVLYSLPFGTHDLKHRQPGMCSLWLMSCLTETAMEVSSLLPQPWWRTADSYMSCGSHFNLKFFLPQPPPCKYYSFLRWTMSQTLYAISQL